MLRYPVCGISNVPRIRFDFLQREAQQGVFQCYTKSKKSRNKSQGQGRSRTSETESMRFINVDQEAQL